MIGRCRVYFDERQFGFLEYSSDGEIFDESIFFSGDSCRVRSGDFAEFEIEQDWEKRPKAFNVQQISRDMAPTIARVWQGSVGAVRTKSARIDYIDDDGKNWPIWFSLEELQPWPEDGLLYEPVPGCLVDFQIAIRRGNQTAVNVTVTKWPVPQQTIEEYFTEAEELPIDVPEPVAISTPTAAIGGQPSVLSPRTRKLTLREIHLQRKLAS